MRHKLLLFLLLLAVIWAESFHLAAADTPPIIAKTLIGDEIVDLDGSQTTIFHVEKLATNQSAAHNIAQYALEYSESMETAEILEAFTRKADGKILRFFADGAAKKWPPRGSLKGTAAFL